MVHQISLAEVLANMEKWIPLFQSLVWPVFIVILVIWFRSAIKVVLAAISERIGSGAAFEAGPGGIKIGEIQRPPSEKTEFILKEKRRVEDDLPHDIYITHTAQRSSGLDHGIAYYRISIALDADEPSLLDGVEKVIYHLHPTFKNPDREVADRTSKFRIDTAGWGEFNMTAEVFFKDGKPKLVIERYINLPN